LPAASPQRSLLAAVSFLTVLPVSPRARFAARDVSAGGPFFPLVGAGLGALVGLTAVGLSHIAPVLLAAALATGLGSVLTGCLHLDGLADTADALGGRSREHALAVMRDHRIGTFGAVALIVDLLTKSAAIAALAGRWHGVGLVAAAGGCSRFPPIVLAAVLPYARAGDGHGRLLAGATRPPAVAAALLLAAVPAVALGGVAGGAELATALLLAAVLYVVYRRWLGGVTGDTLGAATELAETAALVVAAALVS
jgi:adenosylcobinamide-GDP ribazoletransferase